VVEITGHRVKQRKRANWQSGGSRGTGLKQGKKTPLDDWTNAKNLNEERIKNKNQRVGFSSTKKARTGQKIEGGEKRGKCERYLLKKKDSGKKKCGGVICVKPNPKNSKRRNPKRKGGRKLRLLLSNNSTKIRIRKKTGLKPENLREQNTVLNWRE